MITTTLLLVSFLIIFLAYQQQAVFESSLLDFNFCTDDLPSIFWGSYENIPQEIGESGQEKERERERERKGRTIQRDDPPH